MNNDPKNNRPPRWFFKLLSFFFKADYLEEIEGDIDERFQDNLERYNPKKAKWLYILDAFKLLQPALMKKLGGDYHLNTYGMFTNNLKIAWRQMKKKKIFSSIKIGGFSIGIAACILIALYIGHQLSFDRHYKDGDRIFRVVNHWAEVGDDGYWSNVHGPLKEVLENNIPEMEQVARTVLWSWGDAGENHIRSIASTYNEYETGFFYADPELLEILETPMIYGKKSTALSEPNSMVISKSKADKYFPEQDPVGKLMVLNDDAATTYVIGGVMEDFPVNSHLKGDFILTLFGRKKGPGTSGWCCTNYNMYAKLTQHANKFDVEKKTAIVRNSLVIDKLRIAGGSGLEAQQEFQSYYLQPIANTYLNPEAVGDNLSHGSTDLVWTFGVIALIILFLAGINFVNLSTANSFSRAKEVGLRKVVGSSRSNLIYQYLSESCLYSLISILLGTFMAWIFLPYFNQLAGTSLVIPWTSVWFLPILLAALLLNGLLAGLYPAFKLSSFQPIDALKGQSKMGKSSLLQSSMVVFQFTATVILIVGALITHQQFQFIMNKSLGYEKDQVVNILGLNTMEANKKETFKEALLKLSSVQNASFSDYLPVEGSKIQNRSYWTADRRQLDNGFEAARWVVDTDYLETMTMQLAKGRNFTTNTSDASAIIINEKMVQALGLKDPLGVQLIDMFDEKQNIIGVVKNFYFESLIGDIRPMVMVYGKGKSTLSVKIASDHTAAAMASMESLWNDFSPNQAIRYSFLDQRYERMYDELNRAKTIFMVFAFLSIMIACLGLLALSIHMIEQRGKEMSIRKVLGANLSSIFASLTFGFLKLVLIAIFLAIPIAWVFADYILLNMSNRITLDWQIFMIAGSAAIIIALGTISFEAIKAALTNPVKQLRNE